MEKAQSTSLWSLGLGAVGVTAALAFLVGVYADIYVLRMVVKPLPVLCLLVWVLQVGRGPYVRWVAIGFVFSLAGDVLLEIKADLFLYGLIAFLVAHLTYIAAFRVRVSAWRWGRLVPFALWGGGVYAYLFPKLGAMALPVGVYVAVICAMMWRAAACLGANPSRNALAWAGLLGAMSFALSDSMIAFNKFNAPFAGARYLIILLYWLGQWGIAYSAKGDESPAQEGGPQAG